MAKTTRNRIITAIIMVCMVLGFSYFIGDENVETIVPRDVVEAFVLPDV